MIMIKTITMYNKNHLENILFTFFGLWLQMFLFLFSRCYVNNDWCAQKWKWCTSENKYIAMHSITGVHNNDVNDRGFRCFVIEHGSFIATLSWLSKNHVGKERPNRISE